MPCFFDDGSYDRLVLHVAIGKHRQLHQPCSSLHVKFRVRKSDEGDLYCTKQYPNELLWEYYQRLVMNRIPNLSLSTTVRALRENIMFRPLKKSLAKSSPKSPRENSKKHIHGGWGPTLLGPIRLCKVAILPGLTSRGGTSISLATLILG